MTGGDVVYGNGILSVYSDVHPGAVSATFLLAMGTFCVCVQVYVVCHGLCGLYIVFLSRTILAKTIPEEVRPYKERPKNSEPKRSQQVSFEMNTLDIDCSSESRRRERNVSRIYHSCLVPITVSTPTL